MNRRKFVMTATGLLAPLMVKSAQPLLSNRRLPFQITASSWTPSSLANKVLWYKASSESYNDGDLVATMTDQSGNARNATQGTDANKPTFKTNILNGKAVYRFDGSRILSTAAFVFGGSKWSALMVVKTTSFASTPNYIERSVDFNSNRGFIVTADATGHFIANHHDTTSSLYSGYSLTNAANTSSFYSFICSGDKTLSTNEVSAQLGSDTAGTRPNNSNCSDAFDGSHSIFIGARSGVSFGVSGDIAELVIISDVISASDITNWLNYVNSTYGI